MTVQYDAALCARLAAEAREDDARMDEAPWAVDPVVPPAGSTIIRATRCTCTGRRPSAGFCPACHFVADFVPEANAAGIARMRNNLRLAADQLEAARVFELELAAARVENERLRSECHDGADRDSKIRQFRTEIARMQPEVTALPRVELRAYALKRARRIVRETPGDSDAWCDPEEWQSEAIELAHAVARLLDEAAGGIT